MGFYGRERETDLNEAVEGLGRETRKNGLEWAVTARKRK
jgi:hypothetical protein